MRIAIVTGIYPPDIGGPATHAADLRAELTERGHRVTVVTLWDGAVVSIRPDLVRFPRGERVPLRMARIAGWIWRNAPRFDVIYATGLHTEAVLGARLAGRPSIVRIVGDPVWERGVRLGLTEEGYEGFESQGRPRDIRLRALAFLRDRSLRASSVVVAPSASLETSIERWLDGPADVSIVRNGVRTFTREPRKKASAGSLKVVFVGRLIALKRVENLLEAVSLTEGASIQIIGSGPLRGALEDEAGRLGLPHDRAAFLGDLDHEQVLSAIRSADVLALASDIEGLPHVLIEALAAGTPVISPAVGGVAEVVQDQVSGLLLADASVPTLVAAITRLRDDPGLQSRLSTGAAEAGEGWSFSRTADAVEAAAGKATRGKPRVVFLGKTITPRSGEAKARYAAIVRHLDPVVVGVGRIGVWAVGRTRVVSFPDLRPGPVGGALFYPLAPLAAVMRSLRRGGSAIVCQSPYEGAGAIALSRLVPRTWRPAVVIEVHGDWRTATRLYGSDARGALAPFADRIAAWAVRRADAVRAINGWTSGLARDAGFDGPIDVYTAFGDIDLYLETEPIAATTKPKVLFVGVLEPYKSVDVLLEAWRSVVERVPGARLSIVGEGSHRERLVRQAELAGLGDSVRFLGSVTRERVRELLDDAALLVLPSRSEGMGRVILEAFARARPVVASAVGGIPELVRDGINGALVSPEDPAELAKALVAMLADPETAAAMGRAGREQVEGRDRSRDFEEGIARLAAWAATRS